jgi:hypothetical protein
MAAVVLNNLTESALSNEEEVTQVLPTAVGPIIVRADDTSPATTVDEFTPSTQIPAEQSAGIFTVSQLPFFSSAARYELDTAAASALVTPNNNTPLAAASDGGQLEALNNSLASLGLDSASIGKIDSIAGATKDFSPSAFTILAYQLKAAQGTSEANTTTPSPKTLAARA